MSTLAILKESSDTTELLAFLPCARKISAISCSVLSESSPSGLSSFSFRELMRLRRAPCAACMCLPCRHQRWMMIAAFLRRLASTSAFCRLTSRVMENGSTSAVITA